jgi:hypothetical protein
VHKLWLHVKINFNYFKNNIGFLVFLGVMVMGTQVVVACEKKFNFFLKSSFYFWFWLGLHKFCLFVKHILIIK